MWSSDGESWVTLVTTDEEAVQALVLSKSITKSGSSRKTSVIVSDDVSPLIRLVLGGEFDEVNDVPKKTKDGYPDSFLKRFCWNGCVDGMPWKKCVFIAPSSIVVRNCDDLFQKRSLSVMDGFEFDVFVYVPNLQTFAKLGDLSAQHGNESLDKALQSYFEDSLEIVPNTFIELAKDDRATNLFEPKVVIFNQEPWSGIGKYHEIWKEIYQAEVLPSLEKVGFTGASKIHHPITSRLPKEDLTNATAIVGMSCRFAGSNSPDEFWEFLAAGRDGIGAYPANRPGSETSASFESYECGFLKCPIDEFDAKFFGISPREARFIDPQQRLLLQVTWEALENAGINPLSLKGSDTSAFVGIHMADYYRLLKPFGASEYHHTYLGNAFSATASRISFFLGLTGPNLAIESGCSSSLVGLHLAVQSLHRGESSLALASGVNLIATRNLKGTAPLEAVLSPDCRCKTYDASANGFVRAEGIGTVVLKRYSDAVKDGDKILGIVRGTASNNDGPGHSFGTPNAKSQERVIAEALKAANLSPAEVSYVEAHGTGTPVGDPLEMEALRVAYSKGRTEPLMVGSVKTNIGHTESAAGIAGLIKVLLCLRNSAIPPHLNLNSLNPAIDLSSIPAIIPTQLTPWSSDKKIAGVSSFSMSGTSAHVIVQEPPKNFKLNTQGKLQQVEVLSSRQHILTISAKTPDSLRQLIVKYLDYFTNVKPEHTLESAAFTSAVCRAHFAHRATVLASSLPQFITQLQKLATGQIAKEVPATAENKIVFLFSGQGSQHVGMGEELYSRSEAFKTALDTCEGLFYHHLGTSLKEVIWDKQQGLLDKTIFCQPALFCVQYALTEHWKALGLKADLVLGHSVGEFAAAVAAGFLSLEDAMLLVVERSRLVDGLPPGQMLVLRSNESVVERLIQSFQATNEGVVDIAAVNSTNEVVVSGSTSSIIAFEQYLHKVAGDMKIKKLAASSAFHSREMDPVMKEIEEITNNVQVNMAKSNCAFISATLAKYMKASDFEYNNNSSKDCYWAQHLRQRVQFARAVNLLASEPNTTFIEIGPHPVLLGLTMNNLNYEPTNLFCPSIKSNEDEWTTFTNTLSTLYLSGLDLNWKALYPGFTKLDHLVQLPNYAFESQKYWFHDSSLVENSIVIHPVIGRQLSTSLPTQVHVNQILIDTPSLSYLQDHKVGSIPILPAAAFVEASLSIGKQLLGCASPLIIRNLVIESALSLAPKGSVHLETLVNRSVSDVNQGVNYEIKFNSPIGASKDNWKMHAKVNFSPGAQLGKQVQTNVEELKTQLAIRDEERLQKWYQSLQTVGIEFGQKFRSLRHAWSDESFVLAELAPVDYPIESYTLHPIIIDAMIQTWGFGFSLAGEDDEKELRLPLSVGAFTWLAQTPSDGPLYVFASKQEGFAVLIDQTGKNLAIMSDLELVKVRLDSFVRNLLGNEVQMPPFYKQIWKNVQTSSRVDLTNPAFNSEISQDLNKNMLQKKVNSSTESPSWRDPQFDLLCYYYIAKSLQEAHYDWPSVGDEISQNNAWTNLLPKVLKKTKVNSVLIDELAKNGHVDLSTGKVLSYLPSVDQCSSAIRRLEKNITDQYECERIYLEFISHCGRHLAQVLSGQMQPLSVLYPSNPNVVGASKAISELNFTKVRVREAKEIILSQLSGLEVNDDSVLRVLEIGGGSGAATSVFLELLTQLDIPFEYTFTDISTHFLDEAKSKFKSYNDVMKYRLLDMDHDALLQGFAPASYDLIISYHVIHVALSIQSTLEHLQLLLSNGGLLYIWEVYELPSYYKLSFAFLDSFWRFTDHHLRTESPIIDEETWIQQLEKVGYSNIQQLYDKASSKLDGALVARKFSHESHLRQQVSPSHYWVVFNVENQKQSYIGKLVQELNTLGRAVIEVQHSSSCTSLTKKEDNTWEQNFGNESHFKDLFSEFNSLDLLNGKKLEGIIYFVTANNEAESDVDRIQKPICGGLLEIAHQLQTYELQKIKLIAVSEGVYSNNLSYPNNATAWGFMRNFISEFQQIDAKIIDFNNSLTKFSDLAVSQLLHVIYGMSSDEKFFLLDPSEGQTSVQRIANFPKATVPIKIPTVERFTVAVPSTGLISDIDVVPAYREDLGEFFVEIAVRAVGLNFRDLMVILKPDGHEAFLPADSRDCAGMDISGVVSAIGTRVESWKIGDEVIAFTKHGLTSHSVVHERCLMPKPSFISFTGASTIPCVFCTSYYALIDLGRLNKEDRVLIHVGAGGIGISAIQIAQRRGATIFTTAGSERKRNYLRTVLGITHVYSSRDLTYKEAIIRDTNGEGVSVVLNALTGPGFKEATLDCCSKGARFIEIGKVNTWSKEDVSQLRPDVEYDVIDLFPMISSHVQEKDSIIPKYMKLFSKFLEEKVFTPLPLVSFPLERIKDAFVYFRKAKNIGKIVIKMPEVNSTISPRVGLVNKIFEPEATYLITGGLGGIGFEMVKWMVVQGAKNVVLVGRNPPTPTQTQIMENIMDMNAGVQLVTFQVDLSDFTQCEQLFRNLDSFPPLQGIMLASGVIQDSLIANATWDTFGPVFKSKVHAAWNLHRLTISMNLNFFVLFSSIASTFGGIGQCNHSAACAYLDALANYRRSLGLVASTINWGAWSDVGAAANLQVGHRTLFGYSPFSPAAGIKALEEFMRFNYNQAIITKITNWQALEESINCKNYVADVRGNIKNELDKGELEALWASVLSTVGQRDRKIRIEAFISHVVKNVLKLGAGEVINPNVELAELGVDSLLTMEMRNHIQRVLGPSKPLTANAMQENRSIKSLSKHILELLMVEKDFDEEQTTLVNLVKADSILPLDITNSVGTAEPPAARTGEFKRILITGGTGFLGAHIIHELLTNTQTQLVCLVRGKSRKEAEERIIRNMEMYGLPAIDKDQRHQLTAVVGNVVKEHFGLPLEEYNSLASEIDAVINLAASRNLLELYSSSQQENSLRSINVVGLLNVLRFVVARRVKHMFHSSYFTVVTDLTEEGNFTEHQLTIDDYTTQLANGYLISKFIGEVLLSQMTELGVPVTTMRFPGFWAGNPQSAEVHGQEITHVAGLVKACLQIRKFPKFEDGGAFPMMVVDVAANLIRRLVTSSTAEIGVYNLVASTALSTEFIFSLISSMNLEIEILEFEQWRDAVFNQENNALVAFKYLYENVNDGGSRVLELHPLFKHTKKIPGFVGDKMYKNIGEAAEPKISFLKLMEIYFKDVL